MQLKGNHRQEQSPHELIVRSSKARKLSLMVLPLFGLFALDVFPTIYNWSLFAVIPGARVIKFILAIVLVAFLLRLVFQFCNIFKRYITHAPVAILSGEGLWLEDYGLIPWENVASIEKLVINPFNINGEEIVGLAICFKNPEILFDKGWLHKRMLSMLRSNNALYHLLLQHLDVDPQVVAQFAKKFIR